MLGALLLAPTMLIVAVVGGVMSGLFGSPDGQCDEGVGTELAVAGSTQVGDLTSGQLANARAIVAVGRQMQIPRRGVVVALAVARQESAFRNYANDGHGSDLRPEQLGIATSLRLPHEAVGSDHGSVGVFQQQWPWWGTLEELMTPATSARKFYEALLDVQGWESMPVTEAGQAVQKSAYPDAYADDVPIALSLVGRIGAGTLSAGSITAGFTTPAACEEWSVYPGQVAFPLPAGSSYRDAHNWNRSGGRWARGHTGTDLSVACGTPVVAATGGRVLILTDQGWSGRWLVQVSTGNRKLTTWYAHMEALSVAHGEQVKAGQTLGQVGSEGNSTGCHLHFEVHPRGGSIYEDGVDPSEWLDRNVGRNLTRQVIHTAATGSSMTATMLTASVPFTLSAGQAREQISYLLSAKPDVLFLQEVTRRDIPAIVADAPGNWEVWQPRGRKGGSALVWNADLFSDVRRGAELGFHGRPYDRWMTWALLRDAQGDQVPVVALHMPTNASVSVGMRKKYRIMTSNYQELLRTFSRAGHSPVFGGDWNHPLDKPREAWSPVPQLASVGYTTNWQHGTPCRGSSGRGGRIDGFAYQPASSRVTAQGCLERRHSDHRPVWISIRPG